MILKCDLQNDFKKVEISLYVSVNIPCLAYALDINLSHMKKFLKINVCENFNEGAELCALFLKTPETSLRISRSVR